MADDQRAQQQFIKIEIASTTEPAQHCDQISRENTEYRIYKLEKFIGREYTSLR
jgi:hypothetical protein